MIGRSAKDILIHIKGDDKDFQGALKRSDTSMGAFASSMKSYAPMIGAAFAAATTAAAAYSVKSAIAFEQVSRGFTSLAASQGKDADIYIQKLKEMSHNTVSELDMMQNATKAMLLGIDLDTITKMMEGATIIAKATGQDVGYMFESLVLGVGRQSRMLLDNLGIIVKVDEANRSYAESLGKGVSELTAEEAKAAFLTATLVALNERTEALGGYTEDTASQIHILKANMDDAAVSAGTKLLPALESVVGGLNLIIEKSGGAGAAGALAEMVAAPIEVAGLFGEQIARLITINNLKKGGIDTEQELVSLLQLQSNQLNDMSDAEFERKIYLMEGFGFAEKAAKLEDARVWGLRHMLEIEKELTAESEKQVTLEEKKASYLAKYGQTEAMRAKKAGIDLSRLGAPGETVRSGQLSITTEKSSVRSGV